MPVTFLGKWEKCLPPQCHTHQSQIPLDSAQNSAPQPRQLTPHQAQATQGGVTRGLECGAIASPRLMSYKGECSKKGGICGVGEGLSTGVLVLSFQLSPQNHKSSLYSHDPHSLCPLSGEAQGEWLEMRFCAQ